MIVGAVARPAAAEPTTPPAAPNDEPETKVSETLTSPSDGWRSSNFRLSIHLGYERLRARPLYGYRLPPDATGVSFALDPSLQLTPTLSLGLTMRYTVLNSTLTGLRWSITAGPVFHPVVGLSMSVAAGYAGVRAERDVTEDEKLLGIAETVFPAGAITEYKNKSLCDGDGVMGLGRIGYVYPFTDLFATGPVVQIDLQWIHCREENAGTIKIPANDYYNPVNVEIPILRRERWLHYSWTLGWTLAWR